MANDFKRMWTQEELEKLAKESGLTIGEPSMVVGTTSGGKVYNKDDPAFNGQIIKFSGREPNTFNYYYRYSTKQFIWVDTDNKYIYKYGLSYRDFGYAWYPVTSVYVDDEQFENLVREVPTDVNLVQDQGTWQLQLEHDSNVLSITDIEPFTDWVVDTIDAKIGTALTEGY